jgi:hypothetical protein
MWRGWLVLVASVGCDDVVVGNPCPPTFREEEDGSCVFDEDAVVELAQTFRNGDLEKINAEPFLQVFAAGPRIRRNVWVTPLDLREGVGSAADLYAEVDPAADTVLDRRFPVGTVIVHEAVDGEEGNAIQVKRERGYDDGFGRQWWFTKIHEDGTPDDNPCAPCVTCHSLDIRPGSDGLWGVPREAL